MSYRPHDWSALDLSSDPVPGDPEAIRVASGKLKTVANSITTQATRLRALSSTEGWDSDSGEVFHTDSGKLAGAIEKAHGRYKGVSDALAAYANDLEAVQTTADGYLTDAQNAEQDASTAKSTTLPDPDAPNYQDEKDKQDDATDTASGALAKARSNIQALVGAGGEYSRITKKAADAITAASDDDLKDVSWEWFRDWVHNARAVLENIKTILMVVGTLLAIAILILSLVIPGANIISALLLASLVIAVVNLAIVGAQAAAGDATASDVAWAALDVVLSAVGVKFPPLARGASLESFLTGKFTSKLTTSLAHNFGWSMRQSGGNYSSAFRAFKELVNGYGETRGTINTVNVLLGGDIGKLLAIRATWDSARATEFMIPAVIASGGFVAGKITEYVAKGIQLPETIGSFTDIINFPKMIDEHNQVSVGSL
ncbi:hypothetical protein BH11ACT2_BH11ACT2_16230 [soil metagenome]